MTPQDTDLIKDVHTIKNSLTTLGLKLDIVHTALVGNEIAQDGGLVAKIKVQDKEIEALSLRIEILEKKEAKRLLQVNILWGVAGAVAMLIVKHFL